MKKSILIYISMILIGFITSSKVLGQQGAGWDMAVTPFAHLYESSESKNPVQKASNKKNTIPAKQTSKAKTSEAIVCQKNYPSKELVYKSQEQRK